MGGRHCNLKKYPSLSRDCKGAIKRETFNCNIWDYICGFSSLVRLQDWFCEFLEDLHSVGFPISGFMSLKTFCLAKAGNSLHFLKSTAKLHSVMPITRILAINKE